MFRDKSNQPTFPGIVEPSMPFDDVRDGRRSTLFYYDVDLTVAHSVALGNPVILNLTGNSFYVDQDTANVGNAIVHFQDTNLGISPAPIFVSPGFIANVPFTQLLIENAAQSGKRLRIFYGVDIDFQAGVNASISIGGTVSIVDGGLARTLLNQAFCAFGSAGPTVGQYNYIGLFNPVGSGKNLIVEKLNNTVTVAGQLEIGITNFELSTFLNNPQSKLSGGTASVARMSYQTNAALLLPAANRRFVYTTSANMLIDCDLREPIILTPGYGVICQNDTVNQSIYSNFEFFEQAV